MAIYCSLAFGSASIDQTGYKPCCNFQGKFDDEKSTNGSHLNDPHLIKVRELLKNDKWPKGCVNCKESEENGYASMRTIWNQGLGNDIPMDTTVDPANVKYLDLTFSNKCNSKCMTCGPAASTLWEDEWNYIYQQSTKDLPKNTKRGLQNNIYNLKGLKIYIEDDKVNELIQSYPNVESIAFVGGEPTIHEEGIRFLKELIKLDRAKNISISYVTNLTGLTQDLTDVWQEFKEVHLSVSIDGYGIVNEYIRYPFKWKKIEENVTQMFEYTILYPDRYTVSLSHTASLLSILHSHDLLEWWWELTKKYKEHGNRYNIYGVFLNRVWSPAHFKTNVLSKKIRYKALVKLQKLEEKILSEMTDIDYFHGVDDKWKDQFGLLKTWLQEEQEVYPQLIDHCLHFIDNSDKFRKRAMKDFIPDVYEELQQLKTKMNLTSHSIGYEIIDQMGYTNTEIEAEVKQHLRNSVFYNRKMITVNENTEWKTEIAFPHTLPEYNNLLASDYKQDVMGVSIVVPLNQKGAEFCLVPSSHEKDWPLSDLADGLVDSHFINDHIQIHVPFGSAVLFNPRILHSFAPLKVTHNYEILLINYVKSDIIENLKLLDTENYGK